MTEPEDAHPSVLTKPAAARHWGSQRTLMSTSARRVSLMRAAPAALALAILLILVSVVNPTVRSYSGATLLLSTFVPLALAAIAQMFVMAVGDIDLGIGKFVGLVNAIAVTILAKDALEGVAVLAAGVLAYIAMGLIVYTRRAPAIVVTLGASFVWLGVALLLLPSPGGTAPQYLVQAVSFVTPAIPYPIVLFIALGVVVSMVLLRTPVGSLVRGVGGSKQAIRRAGGSEGAGIVIAYGVAGCFAVLAGLAITGVATSGDVTVGSGYTLNTIAAVILGGGRFSGGQVSAAGTILGALVVGLVGTALSFVHISSTYDFGVEGLLLLAVVSLRWALQRRSAT